MKALLEAPGLHPVLEALPRARIVGGAVRDALLERTVTDIDLATPEPPEEVARRLEAAGLRVIPTGLSHGTLTAMSGGRPFEITTLRRDVETDGRHATVAWIDDWREDAARRDFTINAMSLDRAGMLHDYFGGQDDLRHGRVRFVGEAARRVAEDYLRILRFFRFQARYGRGEVGSREADAIRQGLDGLAALSAERVWSELKRILAAPDPVPAIRLMKALGVLERVMPEGSDPGALARLIGVGAPADPLLRMAALLTGDTEHFAVRLKLSGQEREMLAAWRGRPVPDDGDDAGMLRRMLADEPVPVLAGRAWLAGQDRAARRLEFMQAPGFPLSGRDVVGLGVPAGPPVGDILRQVRERWLEQGCPDDAGQLHSWLREAAERWRAERAPGKVTES